MMFIPACTNCARSRVVSTVGVVLAVLVLLSGCSAFKFWYGFAGDMIESRAEDYLDLDTDQQAALEQQSAALIAWHRQEMLPKYAAFFNAQADIAKSGGWTRAQMSQSFATFHALLADTVKGASPYVATVLADHMTKQKLEYLKARMAEHITERRAERETESPEDALEDWVERRADGIKRFTGTLDNDQIDIIRRHLQNRGGEPLRWLDNREKRHAAMIAFLHTGPAHHETARFVQRIVLRPFEITDPDYRSYSDAYWATLEAVYFDVMASLNDQQRRELISTLRSYASDMMELAVGT